jgi:hypothetical protein
MANELLLGGWIEPKDRTMEQNDIHAEIMNAMPKYAMPSEGTPEKGFKVFLTNLWSHPEVVDALGFEFPGWHQYTGSCVGVGGGNGAQTLCFVDALMRNEPEKIILGAWCYNYGRSRLLAGMRGQGEGSLGSTFAKSLDIDGFSDWIKTLGLPDVTNSDQLTIGKNQEFAWSDGTKASQALRDEAKPRRVISTPVQNGEGVRDAIINGYPVLRAFGSFVNPQTDRVRNGVSVGTYNGRGGHQESWLNYWNHPQEGELIYEMNQWGKKAYTKCPSGVPEGGTWVRLEDVDRKCKEQYAEIYALSGYDGYPAQPKVYDWTNNSFFS